MTPMDELSRLLAAERAASAPSGAANAGLERLLTSLAANVAPLPVATGAVSVGWGLISKWVAVGVVIGMGGAGAASYASDTGARASQPAARIRVVNEQAPAAAPVSEPPAPLEAAPAATTAQLVPSLRERHSSAQPAADASASPPPTFDEELRLITAAKSSLDAAKPHLAQAWLAEHRQRFASGVFALEREGLMILARCSDRPDLALAQDFATRHPESPMIGQLTRRCTAPTTDPVNANAPPGAPTAE